MKRNFKNKILIGALLSLTSTTFALDKKDIAGDYYWGGAKEATDLKDTKFNIKNISSSSIAKTIEEESNSKISAIRLEMLQSAARAFGTQAGFASGGAVINRKLDSYNGSKSRILDQTYDFKKVQLEKGFLPPVITEGRDAYNQPNSNEVRAADVIYKIEIPAKIVNNVPDWRVYLYVDVSEPENPSKSVLPTNSAENKVWDEYVKLGWEDGYEQAADQFGDNLARLERDFTGMLRYKRLYELGMVTKPKLSRSELGITGGGKEMAIGDRVIKKTQDAQLNPNKNKWFK